MQPADLVYNVAMMPTPDPSNQIPRNHAASQPTPQAGARAGEEAPLSDAALPPVPAEIHARATVPAILRVDTTFEFLSGGQIMEVEGAQVIANRHFSRPGTCRIHIFNAADGTTVVIATDLDEENPGPSVTNAAEDIASQVCLRYGLDPERTVFVEHYDDRFRGVMNGQLVEAHSGCFGRENGESFDWVTFPQRHGWEFGEPAWKHATKAQVEALIGQKLP